MLAWIFFFFVAFGSKVLLALAMIYLILEEERGCPACDGETLLVRMRAAGRMLSVLTLGRVQRRWCPRCGWEGMTRTGTLNRPAGIPGRDRALAPGGGARPRKP